MSEPVSISTGIAGRYATAVFELAKDSGDIAGLESQLDDLVSALDSSADLRDLISSPMYSRSAQGTAIAAVAAKKGLGEVLGNTLSLMAAKRRLFVLPQLIAALRELIAEEKGEMTADVVSAQALTAGQAAELSSSLKAAVGKDIKLNATVDESLIGGLVVKVGSRMIDTSIRSKLNALQNTMKEVG